MSDPWVERESESTTRPGWFSPYQQYSPPAVKFVSTAEEAIFATCQFTGTEFGDAIKIAQMEGKPMLVKREFCSSNSWSNEAYTLTIHEVGNIDVDTDGN